VKNPAYKGLWKARQIPNPDHFEDSDPYAKFPELTGAGFELWVLTNDIAISNVYIGNDETALKKWNEAHFLAKHGQQKAKAKAFDNTPSDSTGGTAATPTPRPTLRASGEGAFGALQDFVFNLKDLWLRLYHDNEEATMITTVVIVAVPIIFVLFAYCREPEPQPLPLTPEELKARKRARRAARKAKAAAEAEAKAAAEAGAQGSAPDPGAQGGAPEAPVPESK
jgi:hypothetical protein